MTLSISMWNIQGLNSSAFGLKSLNTEFQKSIKEMDIIILQETCRADAITHCPPNYREIIYHKPTGKRLRRTNNLVQIKISQPHQHSKARQILHLAQNPQGTALIQKRYIPVCHIHPAIRVPLLQRRHVLHIRGRDEPLPGPGKRAHLRGPERKNRTTAGLHRHTREQIYQQQIDRY